MKHIRLIVLLILAGSLPLSAETKKIVVVYTNSLNGYMDYCTCKADPKGGLVKRGTAFKEIRKQYAGSDMYFADTGDFLPVYFEDMLPPYIFKGYEYLSYDALTFGDQDLDHGIPMLLSLTKKLPFVSTNSEFTAAGIKNTYPKKLTVTKNNSKAVFISAQTMDSFRFSREDTRAGIKISDPAASASAAAKTAAAEHPDITILLSHAGFAEDQKLAEKIKGVQLIIGGHSQTKVENPARTNGIYILQAGSNGSHIGIAEIEISGGKIISLKNRFVTPDFNSPQDDQFIRSMINEYRNKIENTQKKFD